MFTIEERAAGICVFRLDEMRLTAAVAPALKDALAAQVEAGKSRLVLDMGRVSFVDSTGLGTLVGLLKRVGTRGELVVCGVQPAVRQMFQLTRMDRVFRIFGTADQAVSELQGA